MDQQLAGSSTIKTEAPGPVETVNKIRRFKIFDDISSSQEKYKLPVYNYVDFRTVDTDFKYLTKCRRRSEHIDKEPCCNCKPNECNTARCYCWKSSTIRLQNRKVKNIQDVLDEPMDRILIECREECGCRKDCNNWMTDEKIQFRLEIDYFEKKGFGIRIKDFASRGEYFGEYIGEIMEEQERKSERGISVPFLFVRNAENSQKFPQLGFIFNRAVSAGNEITIDYAKGYWDAANYDCCCGSFECMKPSADTHYGTQISSKRIQTVQKREDALNERIVEEANLCKKRIELLQRGRHSREEVMRKYPRKVCSKKPNTYTRYTIYDRCPSPILPPHVERFESDSEVE
ncbi:Histone-lysine N-methyltransferase, H3 lysine-9 specific SUVH5-like [Aphelenchoides bicaudatus]|nr:Histone-lysine N-methyltransferase, H3 lysine-9 specific SUVH5-like [Aphelenchoides bicaudatus]